MNKLWRNLIGIPLMTMCLASVLGVSSVASDYYASITNTTNGSNLSSSLHTLITNTHTTKLSYANVWTAYKTTDTFPGTPIIWDTYSEYFRIGAAISPALLEKPEYTELIKAQFNSVTTENNMKQNYKSTINACYCS